MVLKSHQHKRKVIVLELTRIGNRSCRQSNRHRADARSCLTFKVADAILSPAKLMGVKAVACTGGEVAL
ncbi:MAG: hypothetical protein PHW74_10020 [Desulfobacca sp.]|nr:hypothetical protein [Desulfobacca sp.]